MIAVDFGHAPAPTEVDGNTVVPLHVVAVHARVALDARRAVATVKAVMDYVVGPAGGHPFFDLRQPLQRCWLDGHEVPPADLAARRIGPATVRVIGVTQRARSRHRLRVSYRLGAPRADLGGSYPPVLAWSPGGRVRWSLGSADLYAGRYLEAWLPSNLPFDHFPLRVDLAVTGTAVLHALVSNGDVRAIGLNRWSIRFPSWYTTMSPLIELHAADSIQSVSASTRLPRSRRPITVEVVKFVPAPENLTWALSRVTELLRRYEARYGDFTGRKFVCLLHGAGGGMEYAHATTTAPSAMAHELFHSWFARGVTPAAQADGWWDEGLSRFHERGATPVPFAFDDEPVELCSRDPFQRVTPVISYAAGSRFFAGVAALIGLDRLDGLLSDLFMARRGASVSTAMLEEHLVAGSGDLGLVDGFHRFVYGLADPLPTPHVVLTDANAHDDGIEIRVGNRADAGFCRHFLIAIAADGPGEPGTTMRLPIVAAKTGFDLAAGESRVVSVALRPPTGTNAPTPALVAIAHTRGGAPTTPIPVRRRA
jgi:hypothetical protein